MDDKIKIETSESPDGDKYHMFWLTDEQMQKLMNVLWTAEMWSPTDQSKKNAGYLYFDIGFQLGFISEETAIHFKMKYGL